MSACRGRRSCARVTDRRPVLLVILNPLDLSSRWMVNNRSAFRVWNGARGMPGVIRWPIVAALIVVIVVAPIIYFRCVYDTYKRLRVVEPGRVYRSGQMTAEGFAEAVQRYGLRTIINVQDDFPDPDITCSFWDRQTIKESELCRQLGVRYIHLMPTLLPRQLIPAQRPPAIDE